MSRPPLYVGTCANWQWLLRSLQPFQPVYKGTKSRTQKVFNFLNLGKVEVKLELAGNSWEKQKDALAFTQLLRLIAEGVPSHT